MHVHQLDPAKCRLERRVGSDPNSSIAHFTSTMHDGYHILEKEWAMNTISRCEPDSPRRDGVKLMSRRADPVYDVCMYTTRPKTV